MADWFLPAGAPGSPDEWCFATTGTRELRVYASYLEYYRRLADLFAQAKSGDEIFLVGWGFGLEENLKGRNSALLFLEAARGRGAKVRILSTPGQGYDDNEAQVANAAGKKLDAIIDDQLPPGDTRHHQKAVMVKLGPTTHLFLGGMDVTTGRIDQWFDVQAEIIGRGAILGRKTLEERWESMRPPLGGLSFPATLPAPGEEDEKHKIQFIRTYSPFPADRTGWKRTYAEKGDHTYYALICRAILAAKTSIYLEDHFLWTMGPAPKRTNPPGGSVPRQRGDVPDMPDTLDRLMKDAIARGVKVVIIGPNFARFTQVFEDSRKAFIPGLQNANNPPVLLKVRADMMVVHSKTWIFDDELVVIGSGNFWHKSYVSVQVPAEAEFGVAFTTKADGAELGFPGIKFARALRLRMWERIRQTLDFNYDFPLNPAATFDDEVRELKSPINGKDPFEPM